jgi:hypothetical protein
MEPVRPAVDAFLLDLLERCEFHKEDFVEMGSGQCRLLPALTPELALTAPTWARRVLPIAQRVATELLHIASTIHMTKVKKPRTRRGQHVVVREYASLSPIAAGEKTDSRLGREARAKRRRTMKSVLQANRTWEQTNCPSDPAFFRREILPQIQGLSIKTLMSATGLSKGACSRIRSGGVVPHARHWSMLREAWVK